MSPKLSTETLPTKASSKIVGCALGAGLVAASLALALSTESATASRYTGSAAASRHALHRLYGYYGGHATACDLPTSRCSNDHRVSN